MNHCIKCGRQIPEGELFCVECSLNPGSSLFEEPRPQDRPAAPVGRMQAPRPAAKQPAAQPVPQAAKPRRKGGSGTVIALVIVSILLALSVGSMVFQYSSLKVERTRLETKEADMLLREREKEELQLQMNDLNLQLQTLNDTIAQKDEEIEDLKKQLSGSQSSQSQSQYDLTTTQAELERLEEENAQLLLLEQELEEQIEELGTTIQDLEKALEAAREFEVKANFMDSYVVFVQNDGSRVYHTYDCENFSKDSFWAYSRKLAESSGFSPCPVCGGRP